MKIAITGATWLIGRALLKHWESRKEEVIIVSRSQKKAQRIVGDWWSIVERSQLTKDCLDAIEICIHLSGKKITSFPRNTKNKKEIRDSRIETTKKLVSLLPDSCHTFICASAVWYYPSSKDFIYDEKYVNTHPQWFMQKLCIEREKQALKATKKTRRVVMLRTWLVIWKGTFEERLKKLPFAFFRIVAWDGEQRMPLIDKEERVEKLDDILCHSHISGPVNMIWCNRKYKDFIKDLCWKKWEERLIKIAPVIIRFFLGAYSSLILSSWRLASIHEIKKSP